MTQRRARSKSLFLAIHSTTGRVRYENTPSRMKYRVARMKTGVFHARAMRSSALSQSGGDQCVPGSAGQILCCVWYQKTITVPAAHVKTAVMIGAWRATALGKSSEVAFEKILRVRFPN